MSQNPKFFKSFSIFYFRVFCNELFKAEYMDKIHREIVTDVLLNHTYFTKTAFIEGNAEKSLEILNFLINSAPSIFVHEYPGMEYSPQKMLMKTLFNASLDQSYNMWT